MCDRVPAGLSFIPAPVVRALPVVAGVGIEPGRARAHLLVDHLAKVVPRAARRQQLQYWLEFGGRLQCGTCPGASCEFASMSTSSFFELSSNGKPL